MGTEDEVFKCYRKLMAYTSKFEDQRLDDLVADLGVGLISYFKAPERPALNKYDSGKLYGGKEGMRTTRTIKRPNKVGTVSPSIIRKAALDVVLGGL